MDIVSLIVLIAVIAAAFIFKVNTGLAAILASLVLVYATGMPEKFILSAFDSKMFLMLFGVMHLFCIAQENKTLDVLARKVLNLCKGNAKVAPFTGKQWATLGGIIAVAVMAFLGINVGLAAICVAVLLTVFRCTDEAAALKKVSWGTLLMINGVGILISLVTELGGLFLLRRGFRQGSQPHLPPALWHLRRRLGARHCSGAPRRPDPQPAGINST